MCPFSKKSINTFVPILALVFLAVEIFTEVLFFEINYAIRLFALKIVEYIICSISLLGPLLSVIAYNHGQMNSSKCLKLTFALLFVGRLIEWLIFDIAFPEFINLMLIFKIGTDKISLLLISTFTIISIFLLSPITNTDKVKNTIYKTCCYVFLIVSVIAIIHILIFNIEDWTTVFVLVADICLGTTILRLIDCNDK